MAFALCLVLSKLRDGNFAGGRLPVASRKSDTGGFGKTLIKGARTVRTCKPATFANTFLMTPRFTELNKVRVICERFGDFEGFVIASQLRDEKWVYKISSSEDATKPETFDNWIPEECLELTK